MRAKLTATRVKALSKPGRHSDGDGLYLLIKPDGRKSWVFLWTRDGHRREMGLGSLAGTGPVSLALAREKADHVRAILARGGDPFKDLPERRQRAQRVTFAEARDKLLATLGHLGERHLEQWRTNMGEAYCAKIVNRPVALISTDDIVAVLQPIWAERHRTAKVLRGWIERVLDYAATAGLREGWNPARWKGHLEHLLGKPAVAPKPRGAMPIADVPGFYASLAAMDTMAAAAFRLQILTAMRPGEVRKARWDEVRGDVWTVPGETMKMKRPHRVPLTAEALAVVEWARERSTGDLIFPGRSGAAPMSDMTFNRILRNAGLPYDAHGFRSTFRDWAGDFTDFPREIAEAALAHQVGDETERAYRRSDALEKRRALMAAWAGFVTGGANG